MQRLRRIWLPLVMLALPLGLGIVFFGLAASGSEAEGPQGSPVTPQATPSPRFGHSLATIDGYAYLFGGLQLSGASSPAVSPLGSVLNDLWKYNFADNVWAPIVADPAPPARAHHSASVSAGRMYVFGGNDAVRDLDDIWSYDPTANRWRQEPSQGTSTPEARSWHQTVGIDSRIYMFGG
ncbi:MAG: hypothetical protein HY675_02215 [Chloroflexi bacterium]|nr:hypothetical protein [Chloroflexota bacterium]